MLIAINKPYGILSQFTPEPGSAWGTLAQFGLPPRVYPLGRLDADSEGLLLLSDEAGLNTRLLDPAQAHRREYWSQVEQIPNDVALGRLRGGGLSIMGGYQTLPCRVRKLDANEVAFIPPRNPPVRFRKNVPDCWLALELIEGKNRQVRRMTAAVGHPTLRLVRVAIGALRLAQLGLGPGEWRQLDDTERRAVFHVER